MMHKKRGWIWLFTIVMGIIILCSSSKSKIVMAQEEQPNETTIIETTSEVMESTPELSSWEEPQRSLEELLDLEKSRVAATGVNRRAPFYVAFQLKTEFSDWVVTALNYQSTIQPSESFLVEMNMQQPGLYIGERVTTDEMVAGEWKLREVWVMSPRRVVLCITPTSQEEIFSRFDFSLVENPIIEETSTEEGSLVERPEAGGLPSEPVSSNPTSAIDPLPVASEAQPVASEAQPIAPETAPIASQVSEAIPSIPPETIGNVPAPEQTIPVEVSAMEQQQVEVAALKDSEVASSEQSLMSSESLQETKQSKEETKKTRETTAEWEESEQESLENTETESNVQNEWSFLILIIIFAGAGIVLIYIQNKKQ
ncbi:hypothetical protein NDGK_03004 [Clostridiales bacterium CHKCI001]|nr:hypothetical protein NDGK_03004 [Clostridiales bacterium CHKCI001]